MESDETEERLEDLAVYRLDYESAEEVHGVAASGGEALQPGDHVYMWCTLYQHHGIVLEIIKEESQALIAEFTNAALEEANQTFITSSSVASNAVSADGVAGGFRIVRESEPTKWHRVKYQANPLECLSWRPGTCSAATPSPVATILTRVQFLRDCRHWIPSYHLLASNCETVATWCVTGKWETLQGRKAMQLSQIGSVALTTSWIPAVGVAAGGLAVWHSRHIGQQWQKIAVQLNAEFEWYAMGRTPEFNFSSAMKKSS